MTNLELYERYHNPKSTDELRQSDLKILKQRASYGNRDAAFYVDKIEMCK